jgi:hypothetical protein
MTGHPIGLVSTGRGKFPEETSSEPCKWVMWARDVQASGCSESRGCKALPVGAFVEGELHLSWMQIFPSPFIAFYSSFFYFYFFISFFFKRLIRGHCPGVVTSGDSVTHKYFHRNEKVGS